MPKRIVLCCVALAAGACGRRIQVAPALFPMAQVWTAPLDDHTQGPLATDGRLLFVATRDGALRGLDLADGALRWRVTFRPGLLAARKGLLVARDADGTVWGMDPDTGSARWKTETGIPGTLAPVLDGDRVVVAGKGLAVLEGAKGAVLWSVPDAVVTEPPTPSGRCLLVAEENGFLRCREPGTGNSVWTWPAGGEIRARPVVDEDENVLLGTTARSFVALRLADGHRRWRWKLGADVRTPAAVLRDQVVFGSHEAVLYALKRGNGNMGWRANLPSRPLSGPLLQGEGVIIACYGSLPSENLLLGFDGRSGRRVGELRTPAELEGDPLLHGDRLFLALRDLRVLALQLAAPSEPEPPPASPSPHP